jgi:hypothetical protein
VEGETVVLDRRLGLIHQFNCTVSYIWDCCDGNSDLAAIIAQFAATFAVDPETAEKDVAETVKQLGDLGLIDVN